MRIGLLGLGKMGSLFLEKLKENGDIDLFAYSHHPYEGKGVTMLKNEEELFTSVDILILCIKPQSFPDVLAKFFLLSQKPDVIVSIAAGITIDYLQKHLAISKVVRLMPNTACSIGQGVITMAHSNDLSAKEIGYFETLFSSLGTIYPVEERLINAYLPLNGSFPAYFYYYLSCFITEANKNGCDEEIARDMIFKTVIGGALLAQQDVRSLDAMINDVCSKKGTTIAGLDELKNDNLAKAVSDCYLACYHRAKELEK